MNAAGDGRVVAVAAGQGVAAAAWADGEGKNVGTFYFSFLH